MSSGYIAPLKRTIAPLKRTNQYNIEIMGNLPPRICARENCNNELSPESRFDRLYCSAKCQKSENRKKQAQNWSTYKVTIQLSAVAVVRTSNPELINNPHLIQEEASKAVKQCLTKNLIVVSPTG